MRYYNHYIDLIGGRSANIERSHPLKALEHGEDFVVARTTPVSIAGRNIGDEHRATSPAYAPSHPHPTQNASSTSDSGLIVTSVVRQMNRGLLWAWLRDYGADREPIPKPGDFARRRSRQTRPKGEAGRDPLRPGDNQISPFGGHFGSVAKRPDHVVLVIEYPMGPAMPSFTEAC